MMLSLSWQDFAIILIWFGQMQVWFSLDFVMAAGNDRGIVLESSWHDFCSVLA